MKAGKQPSTEEDSNGQMTFDPAQPKRSRQVSGVMMNYLHICHTELWYFANDIVMEHNSELVHLGRLAHEEHYERDTSKEELLLEGIRIDRISSDGYVHEIKKSARAKDAHIWQLKYYLWRLEAHGFGTLAGILEFPKQHQRLQVTLQAQDRQQLAEKCQDVRDIIRRPQPPPAQKIGLCRSCSYRELCWC